MTPPPEWPTPPEHGPRLSALANWVEDQLPEATAQWGDEIFDFDPSEDRLRRSERAILLAAFDGRGENRWHGVAALVRSGKVSPRFQGVVADLMEQGGFAPRAKLASYKATLLFHDKRLIEKILKRDYPNKSPTAIVRMATSIMAIMLKPTTRKVSDLELLRTQKADVQEVVKLTKDKRNQALALIRWRVQTEPTQD